MQTNRLALLAVILLATLLPAAPGCIMLDPTVTLDERVELDAPLPAGAADLGPYVFEVQASEGAADQGVEVTGRLLTPLESGDNSCDDLGVGDFTIDIDLYHPATDQHWTSTYTRESCRGFTVRGDLPCDGAGACTGRYELRVHAEGLTAPLDSSVWLRAYTAFNDSAERGDATLTVTDVTPG